MKGKSFGSNCVYPSIFKDYFLEAINQSGYQNKIIYKDLNDISINLLDMKVNMYSVNIILGTIFRHYKKVKFNVLQVKKIYHVKEYQLYNVKISINFKGLKYLMNLYVGNTLKNFPSRKKIVYFMPTLKKNIEIYTYTKEEILADLFYQITNNLNINAINLYNLYLMFNDNINTSDLKIALKRLYLSIFDNIDINFINKGILNIKNNKKLYEKWLIFKNINPSISILYEDIIKILYLIALKLK